MNKYTLIKLLVLMLVVPATPLFAKNTQYVSDQLTIPMRTGTTMNHKILKFLKSGMAVEILEFTDDQKYARVKLVEDETKVGWVEMALIMPEPSAREQMVAMKARQQTLKEKQSELKQQLTDMNQQNSELQDIQQQLESKIQGLQDNLARLRKSAADPIRIADENQQLKQQLKQQQAKNQELIDENAFLADQNIKQWFMIGAAVSIGSLLLGIILTRINWRKKDSWAGSF